MRVGSLVPDKARDFEQTPGTNLAGPLLQGQPFVVRYGVAVALVFLAAGLRLALTPVLGTQALLLPFVLAVLGTALLAGLGPALAASILAPALATPIFTDWPNEVIATAWWGHVLFFLVISAAVAHLMHGLQRAMFVEHSAQVAIRQLEWEAHQSEAQLRLLADSVPFLISYIDKEHRYRFVNTEHKTWFGVEPSQLIGCHAQAVWGDAAYQMILPQIEASLAGRAVDHETEMPAPSPRDRIQMHFRPDLGSDGSVRGFFATIVAQQSQHSESVPGRCASK